MSDVAIRVKNLSKRYKLYNRHLDRLKDSLGLTKKKCYKEHYALKNISFDVHRGETVGIIGTNGSGKSTILKIITGVLNPTEGEVEINGRISALLELGAGFNMEYTGIENVYLNGMMIGFSKEEVDAKLDAILEFADIGDFVHQPVKTYSSGMFVRLAFAVAINIDPEILIVDEALSVGDVFFQNKCYHKFEEFKEQGKTIIFVSHDLSSISRYCDRVILLNKGDKLSEGEPGPVIDLYKKVLVDQMDETRELQATDFEEDMEEEQEAAKGKRKAKEKLWKSNYVINPQCQEYGDKLVTIEDFALIDENKVYTSSLVKGKKFQLKVKIKAHQDVADPIVAFTIRDLKAIDITGTNTLFEKNPIGPMKKGEERTITFTQRIDIQGGEYLLSLGCTRYESHEFQVYHRFYDVCNISVISDKNTVGFYDMNSNVRVE